MARGNVVTPRAPTSLGPEALVALWPVAVLAWRRTLPTEVFSLSEDDFSRMLDAWAVSGGDLLPADVWPPGPAWLAGAVMRAGVPLHTAPSVVNLASVTLAFVLASDMARRLGASPGGRLAAIAAVATGPWPAWLGLSALAEPPSALGFLAVAHGMVRLGEGGRGAAAQICLGAALAALCRYESWAVALAASAFLASHRGLRVVALVPLVVPVAWTALELHWSGDLWFLTYARDLIGSTSWRPEGIEGHVERLVAIVDACGPLLPLGLLGLWRGRALGSRLFDLWLATLLAYLLAEALQFAGTHNPARLWLGHALLLPVGLALVFDAVRPALTGVLLAGTAVLTLPRWTPAPQGYDADTAAIAIRTREALASAPGSTVVIEAIPWRCVAVKALIGDPTRVVWDRVPNGEPITPDHPSLLVGGPKLITAELAEVDAQFVVTASPWIAARVARVGESIAEAGGWTLWRVRTDR